MTIEKTVDTAVFERRESEARSYCRSFPVVFSSAENATLRDQHGREYIDFLAGCSSLNYGHNDPDMKAALIDYISSNGVAHGLDMFTDAKADFLETFENVILKPRGMKNKVMFTGPTGTNAVEAAMKLARKVTGRDTIVAFTNGFHGMTLGALSATGNSGKRGGASTPLTGIARMPYEGAFGASADTLEQIEMMLQNPSSGLDAPAAFIVEPVQGEGGLNAASKTWMQGIARLAKEHGALLIIDDIQAGIGRTGGFFSTEEFGIDPDMITLAKSLSGMGLPFATLLMKPELDIWQPAEHNGTFRGNNHAFVTATVALKKFWTDDTFVQQLSEKADFLERRLEQMRDKFVAGADVGSGALAAEICADCFENGLIIETSGAHDEVVKVLAPLTIPMDQFSSGLDILEAAIAANTSYLRAAAE